MNTVKTTFLLALLTVLLVVVGGAVGGQNGATIMLIVSFGMNFFSYWFSSSIVLKMYNAREVDENQAPDLYRMVAGLANNAELPMPKVCIIDSDIPNAFATGRNPANAAVAVTTGIMRTLQYDELRGVLAHELAHVRNRDTLTSTVVASIAGVISWIGSMAQWAAIFGAGRSNDDDNGGMAGMLFTIIIAPLAATLIQMGISRSREYEADERGGKICGDPMALARALEKIEYYAKNATMLQNATPATAHMFIINPFSGSGEKIMNLFSTHPATKDRIAKLKLQAAQKN